MGRVIPDLFSLAVLLVVHGLAMAPAAGLGVWLWDTELLAARAVMPPLCCVVFLLGYTVVNGAVRRLLVGRLEAGEYRFGKDKQAAKWRLSMVFNLLFASLFYVNIHYFTFLKFLFYRLCGGKVAWDNLLGFDAFVHEPDLLAVGQRTVVGRLAIISAHVVPDERSRLVIAPIRIGDDCIIGALSVISPGVTIEDRVLVGTGAMVGLHATVGEGSVVLPNSYVKGNETIPPGEIWGGAPAQLIKKKQ